MGRYVGLCAVLVGCFSPHPPAGAPCAASADCPSPLTCSPVTFTCETSATAAVDAQAAPDTPHAGSDAAVVPPDAASATCWPAWEAGTPMFSTPVELTAVSTPVRDEHPWLSPDGLTLYFHRTDLGVVSSTRPTRADAFPAATLATDVASQIDDSGVAFALGGATPIEILTSARTGTTGGPDLWLGTLSQGVFALDHEPLAQVDTANTEQDPDLSPDGLVLVFARIVGTETLQIATRPDVSSQFGAASALAITGAPATTSNPRLSPDQLVLVYSSGSDILFATRATTADTFTQIGTLGFDGPTTELGQGISADGCDVVFSSNRAGLGTGLDLFETTVLP